MRMRSQKAFIHFMLIIVIFIAYAMTACTKKSAELGTEANPIKLYFVPSVDAKVIEMNSKTFKDYLEKNTPYKYEISIPQSYIAVVESFGTKRADIAALNTFGYVLAHEKYGAEARITVIRHGSSTYQSQFIARADSGINKIEDLAGKTVAFVDAASTSGYLLPMKTLKDKKIELKETTFAFKHDNVVSMVYQKQVDAGATFYSPPADGKMEDARRLVLTQYPDVEQKVKIIDLSVAIPNDPVVFRKDLPEEIKKNVTDAFIKFVGTDEGKKAFKEIYGVTELKTATDQDYQSVRDMLTALGKSADQLMKK
ncbi:MAG: phosphate/phosphite/phosphonate ABC transporter substrate-binding protein [Pseudobdellovibrionaceae bacterium]